MGRYTLIYDWCIWVMCDDAKIRKQAAAEQLLEWLQGCERETLPAERFNRKFANLCQRLSLNRCPWNLSWPWRGKRVLPVRQNAWKSWKMIDFIRKFPTCSGTIG